MAQIHLVFKDHLRRTATTTHSTPETTVHENTDVDESWPSGRSQSHTTLRGTCIWIFNQI